MSPKEQSSPVNRRSAIKSLGLAAAAAAVPGSLVSAISARAGIGHENVSPSAGQSAGPNQFANPKWYGFNLLEYFSTDPDWMKYFPYKNDGLFQEDDFRWIQDWGFNWVRLPMDYRFWTDPQDLLKIREEKIAPIDRAIKLGEKYGIHVNICLHRAPGYCVLDLADEAVTGIHVTKEKSSVFTDRKMLDAFVYQWSYFARRYKGISSDKLSFNLVNEPLIMPNAEEIEQLKKRGNFLPPTFSIQKPCSATPAITLASRWQRLRRFANRTRSALLSLTDTSLRLRQFLTFSRLASRKVAIPTIPCSSRIISANGRGACSAIRLLCRRGPRAMPMARSSTVRLLRARLRRGANRLPTAFRFISVKWAATSTLRLMLFLPGSMTH
jgi:hypothetical protein